MKCGCSPIQAEFLFFCSLTLQYFKASHRECARGIQIYVIWGRIEVKSSKNMGTFVRMTDLIRLLPDSVANQIAAGEVVQRPASAVKEMLENTIDSGATDVKLIIREAGKSLIQVVDNGCGMSERDARMCFERHATSKILSADDLLGIRTLGFRGEALASISSISQVELKTKRNEDETGTVIQIEGSKFISQFPVSCSDGTSISVKNLFYNVPARRNFLKSNTLELKYIIEEFFRIGLSNPKINFSFYNHDKILHQVPASSLKQRIVNLFGSHYNQRLIPIEQNSSLINISGFIGKPEFAKKTRGEQYFFTNGRFMKSPYLHHAVENAFQQLIPTDAFPTYFIFFELDPKSIDVNIHPTKTEINFLDIKSIYAILNAAVKQTIGKFNLSPTLDFEIEQSLNIPLIPEDHPVKEPTITVNPDYNPFEKTGKHQTQIPIPHHIPTQNKEWQRFFEPEPLLTNSPGMSTSTCFQVQNSFIVTSTKTGVIIIDQQHAHERILYERLLKKSSDQSNGAQKLLMPQTIKLTPDDALLLKEWLDYFHELGFDLAEFGKNSFVIHSTPSGIDISCLNEIIESTLEGIKNSPHDMTVKHDQVIAKSLAKRLSVKRGKKLEIEEMISIRENLFSCQVPDISPEGKPIFILLPFEELTKRLKN